MSCFNWLRDTVQNLGPNLSKTGHLVNNKKKIAELVPKRRRVQFKTRAGPARVEQDSTFNISQATSAS